MALTWKKLAYEADVITKSVITAKGDLIVGEGTATAAILNVGADGLVLRADSSAANGLAWDAAIMESDFTAKGDLIIGEGTATAAVLNIGSDGYVLTADSSVAGGMAWKSAGAGDFLADGSVPMTGNLDFAEHQAVDMILHTVADATARDALANPVVGKIVFQSDASAAYICLTTA